MALSLSQWENQATTMLHENLNAVHHLTSSLILTTHLKILKNPQNGFFKGVFSLVPTDGAQVKLMKQSFRQWWNSNIYLKFLMAIFYHSVAEPDREVLKMQIRGYVQANSASQRQWRNWKDAADLKQRHMVEFEAKAHGKWYFLDCQDTCTGNPKRLLLRHGPY